MELSDRESCQALIARMAYIIRAHVHIYGMFIFNRATAQVPDCLPVQGRGGEGTPSLSSPPFLVRNWSGPRQSPGSRSQSSSQWEGDGLTWMDEESSGAMWDRVPSSAREREGQPGFRALRLGREPRELLVRPRRDWAMRTKPFHSQLLALTFLWSHQIHKELAPGGKPLLPELYILLTNKL